ncbi:MAG TPA: GNAT family N-acetyltransferase [Candidatus Binataceae bacterium]|nr:GNAT family N-acetyltransferase [Candidatus Binataceae bacterium]
MALRRRKPGECSVEQTRDLALVRAMLADYNVASTAIEWPQACWIAAYLGDDPVGVVGLEPWLDSALIDCVVVIETMRGRGIGAMLVNAARKAAHTRGARSLYAITPPDSDFVRRFGFSEIALDKLFEALGAIPSIAAIRAGAVASPRAWFLDISRDGVIER